MAAPETACYARARKGGSLSELLGYSDLINVKHFSTESINFVPRRYHDACTQYIIGLHFWRHPNHGIAS